MVCVRDGAFFEKNGQKSDFILVFLGRNLYNMRIERAWGGEIPLAVNRSFYFLYLSYLFWSAIPDCIFAAF